MRNRDRARENEWLAADAGRRNLEAEDSAYYAAHNQHDHHT
jgi:hypothetical protein